MALPENRLAAEASPYLRQHCHDPVDWYPYGEEALSRARELDRPLFLSIGYSACHWCHVMAHESFADPETAAEMNETVVAVKVDREERPDVDAVYMEAVVAANGHGGWPMSVFATPDGRPFFAATYLPDTPRHHMPSFRQVLAAVADLWQNRREDVERQADSLAAAVAGRLGAPPFLVGSRSVAETAGGKKAPGTAEVRAALAAGAERLRATADLEQGGFGGAPKFPQPLLLDLLLRVHADRASADPDPGGERAPELEIVLTTLEAMASGGVYDQLGGGFHRYSVDAQWLVPHFEKMLYDQALLARVYLHAWQVTGDRRWRQVVEETLGYVASRLGHPSGAFYSAEDADSEGEEGRYYLWDLAEVEAELGPELAQAACAWYEITRDGNFEGRNILRLIERGALLRPAPVERARELLLARRAARVPPGLDDKVLVEWNAMTCSVLAEAAAATGSARYGALAERALAVLLEARARNGGVTPRSVRFDGGPQVPGFAGDVAWLLDALVRQFELTGASRVIDECRSVAAELLAEFVDPGSGAVHTTRRQSSPPIVRAVESTDGVIPAASSVAGIALARLGALTGDVEAAAAAESIVAALAELVRSAPTAVPELLHAAALVAEGPVEIVAIGRAESLLAALRRRLLPEAVFAWAPAGAGNGSAGLALFDGRVEEAVYVCRRGECRLPAYDLAGAEAELTELRSRR
ncbi:MAG TPA: thioredoxin domain-containing protein [Acidimicrobiales bacterium]|nr:thioredoxin domain-containing protein [Acidimicrobiales bacterium]